LNSKRIRFSLTLLSVLFTMSVSSSAIGEDEKPLRFGVFPYLSAALLEDIYAPVAKELSEKTNTRVHFRTASNFPQFFKKLRLQHYDIALIQPFWYPAAVDKHSYQPLARMKEPFTSLIMVPESSNLYTIEDLRGKVIATPPAFVPVVHMAKQALREAGLVVGKDVTFAQNRSVDSCFQQVVMGNAVACVAPPFAPAVIEEKMKIKLRVLLRTPAIPNLSLLVHKRVPGDKVEAIRQAVLGWQNTERGRVLLRGMKTEGFVPAIDREYDVVRETIKELRIE